MPPLFRFMYFSHLSSAIIFPLMKPSCVSDVCCGPSAHRLQAFSLRNSSESVSQITNLLATVWPQTICRLVHHPDPGWLGQLPFWQWQWLAGARPQMVSCSEGDAHIGMSFPWAAGECENMKPTFIPDTQSNSGLKSSHECVKTMK